MTVSMSGVGGGIGQKAPPYKWGGLLFHKLEDKLAAAALVKRDHRLILQLESVQSKVPFCKDVLKDLDDIYCPVTRISSGTPPTPMGNSRSGTVRQSDSTEH